MKLLDVLKKYYRCVMRESAKLKHIYQNIINESNAAAEIDDAVDSLDEDDFVDSPIFKNEVPGNKIFEKDCADCDDTDECDVSEAIDEENPMGDMDEDAFEFRNYHHNGHKNINEKDLMTAEEFLQSVGLDENEDDADTDECDMNEEETEEAEEEQDENKLLDADEFMKPIKEKEKSAKTDDDELNEEDDKLIPPEKFLANEEDDEDLEEEDKEDLEEADQLPTAKQFMTLDVSEDDNEDDGESADLSEDNVELVPWEEFKKMNQMSEEDAEEDSDTIDEEDAEEETSDSVDEEDAKEDSDTIDEEDAEEDSDSIDEEEDADTDECDMNEEDDEEVLKESLKKYRRSNYRLFNN